MFVAWIIFPKAMSIEVIIENGSQSKAVKFVTATATTEKNPPVVIRKSWQHH